MNPDEYYDLFMAVCGVRPLAWIETSSNSGEKRSIPVSFITPGGTNPATFVVVLHNRPDGTEKETMQNLRVRKDISLGFLTAAQAATWLSPDVAPTEFAIRLEGHVEFVRSMGSGAHGTHFVLISIQSVVGLESLNNAGIVGCLGRTELIDPVSKQILPIPAAD